MQLQLSAMIKSEDISFAWENIRKYEIISGLNNIYSKLSRYVSIMSSTYDGNKFRLRNMDDCKNYY